MRISRREILTTTAAAAAVPSAGLLRCICSAGEAPTDNRKLSLHASGSRSAESDLCAPVDVRYAKDRRGRSSCCTTANGGCFTPALGATACSGFAWRWRRSDKPTDWERLGPVLDLGAARIVRRGGQTYPCVHRIGGRWHLYYSGRSDRTGPQHFSAYWGIGLAQSDDLRNWKKHAARSRAPRRRASRSIRTTGL